MSTKNLVMFIAHANTNFITDNQQQATSIEVFHTTKSKTESIFYWSDVQSTTTNRTVNAYKLIHKAFVALSQQDWSTKTTTISIEFTSTDPSVNKSLQKFASVFSSLRSSWRAKKAFLDNTDLENPLRYFEFVKKYFASSTPEVITPLVNSMIYLLDLSYTFWNVSLTFIDLKDKELSIKYAPMIKLQKTVVKDLFVAAPEIQMVVKTKSYKRDYSNTK